MTWWTDNLLSVVFRIPPTHPGLTVVSLPASKWAQGNVSSGLGTGQETVLTKMILCMFMFCWTASFVLGSPVYFLLTSDAEERFIILCTTRHHTPVTINTVHLG